jgi:AraC-like DNA-binding protein
MPLGDDGSGLVLATLPRILLAYYAARGLDAERLRRAAGLAEVSLDDEDERVPRTAVNALWELGVAESGDPALGVRLAQVIPAGNAGVVELLAQSASTAGEALAQLARYWRLLNDGVDVGLDGTAGRAAFYMVEKRPPPIARAWLELTAAGLILGGGRQVSGRGKPVEVHMPAPRGSAGAELERVTGVPVRWDAPRFALVFDATLLDAPLLGSAPGLHQVLRGHADASLERLAARGPALLDLVRQQIVERLEHGDATLARIARALGTSPRSLQRAIQREGSSLRTLVEETRRQIALRELGAGRRSVTDLAFLLGFSETSVFDRAFRRWTGHSPAEFRRLRRS